MAKTVGYACSIKLEWVKRAFEMLDEGLDEATYKQELHDYLAFEIDSPDMLRKTREILMHLWLYASDEINDLREEAIRIIKKRPEALMPMSLCLLYIAYPVVADICKIMGRLFETHDEVTNTMIRQRLYDAWGERGTLQTTARRVTLTLKYFGVLDESARGRYTLKKYSLLYDEVISFILAVAMKIDQGSYYSFSELTGFDILFPFEYNISKEYILTDEHFMATHFAGEMTISLK